MNLGLHFWQEMPLPIEEEIKAHEAILREVERNILWAQGDKKEKLRREIDWRRNVIKRLKEAM
jgi:hypothetical protein